MSDFVALPLFGVVAAAHLATAGHRRLTPATAARMTTFALSALLIAAVPTIWFIALSGLRHLGVESPFVDWSRHLLPSMGPVGAVVGALALVVAILGLVRAVGVLRLNLRLVSAEHTPIEVIPSDEVFAYTLPGRGGNVVVSRGLAAALDERELQAVVAHERAHGRARHDRYLLIARLAVALVPVSARLAQRLEFSLERWADDEAAREVGDRRLVATTIARVAVAGAHPTGAVLGVGRFGAASRAELLLSAPVRSSRPRLVATHLALAATVIAALYQVHQTTLFGLTLLP